MDLDGIPCAGRRGALIWPCYADLIVGFPYCRGDHPGRYRRVEVFTRNGQASILTAREVGTRSSLAG
jgi:hypothetical protein